MEQKDLIDFLNKDKSTISKWWNGDVIPGHKNSKLISDKFECNLYWLKTDQGEPFPQKEIGIKNKNSKLAELHQIPVLGKVPAGIPNTTEEYVEEYITLPNSPKNCYALKVSGESMEPGIKHGDYVLFVIDQDPKPGDVVVVNDEFGDSMIKRLKEKEGELFLVSDNPLYPTYKPNSEYRIMGLVVGGWRELKI